MSARKRSPYARDSKIVKSRVVKGKFGQKVTDVKSKSRYNTEEKQFKKQYVRSSNLDAVAFKKSENILRIWFKNGTYDYFNVKEEIYRRLLNSSSKGKYFHQYIKNKYTYKKVN